MNNVSRRLERKSITIGAIWQIISGVITIFIYSPYVKSQVNHLDGLSAFESKGVETIISGAHFLVSNIGLFFLAMGIFNLYLVKTIKDHSIEKKKSIWFMACGIISYLTFDIISTFIYIVSSIIMLSKNKAIKLSKNIQVY